MPFSGVLSRPKTLVTRWLTPPRTEGYSSQEWHECHKCELTGEEMDVKRLVLLWVVLAVASAACGEDAGTPTTEAGAPETQPESSEADTLSRAREAGRIDVGFVASRPLSYINEETGEAEGAGIDLARELLRRVEIPEMETIFVTFDVIIPGLQNNRWDMSGFHFFITPERCEQVAFTNPLAKYTQGALVAEGNPLGIHSYEDIADNPEIRVAALAGNAEAEWARQVGVQESQIQSFPETRLAIEAVRQGRADVFLEATFALNQAQELYDVTGVEVADPFTGPIFDGEEEIAYSGYAIRTEDTALLEALNDEIAVMLESGELLDIQAPYGYTEDLMPEPDVTASDLCGTG